jgi:hypothetical protein
VRGQKAMRSRVSTGRLKLLISLVFVSSTIIIFAFGCASTSSLRKEKRSYNEAVEQDTTEAYSEFIESNPDGSHVDEAKKRLVELEWEKTKKANTVDAYARFIEKYKEYPSDTDYIGLAQKNIQKLKEQFALNKSDSKEKAKTSKTSFLRKSKALIDNGAKLTLNRLDKGERQKLYKTFHDKLMSLFLHVWQRIVIFFQNMYSLLFGFQEDEIVGGRIVQVDT